MWLAIDRIAAEMLQSVVVSFMQSIMSCNAHPCTVMDPVMMGLLRTASLLCLGFFDNTGRISSIWHTADILPKLQLHRFSNISHLILSKRIFFSSVLAEYKVGKIKLAAESDIQMHRAFGTACQFRKTETPIEYQDMIPYIWYRL